MKTVASQQSERLANAQQADAAEADVGTILDEYRLCKLEAFCFAISIQGIQVEERRPLFKKQELPLLL